MLSEEYYTCYGGCGREMTKEEAIEINGRFYCEDCVVYCDCCEEYFPADNHEVEYVEDINEYMCADCIDASDYIYRCDNCNELHHTDNLIEYQDNIYCGNCYNEIQEQNENDFENLIYNYHEFRDWENLKTEKEDNPPYYIGFELEMEFPSLSSYEDRENINDTLIYGKNMLPVIYAHDGSLSNGVEMISHPQTFLYYMENEKKYRNVFEHFINNGFRSHDTTTCGLHFHVSRPQNEEIVDRIILIMETYKKELIEFSRRNTNQIKSWCNFLSDFDMIDNKINSLYYIKKAKGKVNNNRYQALNLCNCNTIEFRLFKGTLNFDTFRASLELVNNIMKYASDLTIDITKINWQMITNSKYCKDYCNTRGITTDKKIKDNSIKYIRIENKRKRIVKKVYDLLDDILKDYIYDSNELFEKCNIKFYKKDTIQEKYTKTQKLKNITSKLVDLTTCLYDLEYNIKGFEHTSKNEIIHTFSKIENLVIWTEITTEEKRNIYFNLAKQFKEMEEV